MSTETMKSVILNDETSSQSSSFTLSKWHIALLIGTPIVLGTGVYWYYTRCRRSTKQTNDAKSDVNTKINNKTSFNDKSEKDLNDPFTKAMALKTKGNKMFKDGKYDDAIVCYSDAIRECPIDRKDDISTFYQNRAASYEMIKKYNDVIEDCNKAIELNNKYIKALLRRAKAYEKMGKLQESLNDITAVCILEQFQNSSNLLMTDRLLKEQSKIKAKALFKTRSPRMPSNNFINHYFSSYSRDPLVKDRDSPINIEELNQQLENEHDADDDSVSPQLMLLKGTIEILRGNIESAEKELENLLKLPQCEGDIKVNALIKLGTIKVQDIGSGDGIKEALKCFNDAIDVDSDNPDIYLHRAQIHLLSENVDDARKDLEKCCTLNDSFPSAFAQKLYVQYRCSVRFNDTSSVKKAIDGFEDAIKKFPKSSEVYSLFAQTLMEQQEYSKADKYFANAIDIDPNDGNLYVHRGILHLQWNNDVEKTIKYLEDAKRIDPLCQFVYEMLGSIEVQRGNLQKGLECFDKALDLVQTELDCAHIYSLRDAADAQLKAIKLLGIELPSSPS